LPDNLIYVTGFDQGSTFYSPELPPFLNSLTHVTTGFGYWVKIEQSDTLTVCGLPVPENYRRALDAGWNLIAYPSDDCQPTEAYFSDLIAAENLTYVTGFDQGSLLFDPELPTFLNTLNELCNGYAYWVKVNAAVGKNSWLTKEQRSTVSKNVPNNKP